MLGGIRFMINQLYGILTLFRHSKRKTHFDIIIVRVDAIGDYILWRDSLDVFRSPLLFRLLCKGRSFYGPE